MTWQQKSQGINIHGIDIILSEQSDFSTRRIECVNIKAIVVFHGYWDGSPLNPFDTLGSQQK